MSNFGLEIKFQLQLCDFSKSLKSYAKAKVRTFWRNNRNLSTWLRFNSKATAGNFFVKNSTHILIKILKLKKVYQTIKLILIRAQQRWSLRNFFTAEGSASWDLGRHLRPRQPPRPYWNLWPRISTLSIVINKKVIYGLHKYFAKMVQKIKMIFNFTYKIIGKCNQ